MFLFWKINLFDILLLNKNKFIHGSIFQNKNGIALYRLVSRIGLGKIHHNDGTDTKKSENVPWLSEKKYVSHAFRLQRTYCPIVDIILMRLLQDKVQCKNIFICFSTVYVLVQHRDAKKCKIFSLKKHCRAAHEYISFNCKDTTL